MLSKFVINSANTAVGENGVQSAEKLMCAVLPTIEIRDNSAKDTAYSVERRRIDKALIYKLCGKGNTLK